MLMSHWGQEIRLLITPGYWWPIKPLKFQLGKECFSKHNLPKWRADWPSLVTILIIFLSCARIFSTATASPWKLRIFMIFIDEPQCQSWWLNRSVWSFLQISWVILFLLHLEINKIHTLTEAIWSTLCPCQGW